MFMMEQNHLKFTELSSIWICFKTDVIDFKAENKAIKNFDCETSKVFVFLNPKTVGNFCLLTWYSAKCSHVYLQSYANEVFPWKLGQRQSKYKKTLY